MLKKVLYFLVFMLFFHCVFGEDLEKRNAYQNPFETVELTESNNIIKSIRLHYVSAEKVIFLIDEKKLGLLSPHGFAHVDKKENTIWINDSPTHIKKIENLVKKIDVPSQQILIQAYIVNADEKFFKELGIHFATQNKAIDQKIHINPNEMNIAVAALNKGVSLVLALKSLEDKGRGRILSNPRLMTSDGRVAYIASGEEIPYQEKTTQGNTSVAFKKAVLSLEVTPHVLPKKRIKLDLIVHQDKVSPIVVNGVPAIHTQEVRTQVNVANKQVIVLGGIFEYVHNKQIDKVPVLGDLPVFGVLFRHHSTKRERRELLIFIMPTIVR